MNMDNNKKKAGASSTTKNFDYLFGPKDSSSISSSNSNNLFGSIFQPPPRAEGRGSRPQQVGSKKFGEPGTHGNKGESSSISNKNTSRHYPNEMMEPSYYSSSIYYGGQEIYSPGSSRTTEPHHIFKKDRDGTSGGNDSNSASRGNWWQGSLYY